MTAAELLKAAYQEHGISDPALLESFLAGTDLTQPVLEVTLQAEEQFVVYVRHGGVPGIHGAPVDVDPGTLGIVMEYRHPQVFAVVDEMRVVRCTAANFETGRVPEVGGSGGGVQYVLQPQWLERVRRVR